MPIAGRGAEVLFSGGSGKKKGAGWSPGALDNGPSQRSGRSLLTASRLQDLFDARRAPALPACGQGVARSAEGRGDRAGEIIFAAKPRPYRLRRLRSATLARDAGVLVHRRATGRRSGV